jgi:DNA-binding PadR family transcriptional regulator
VQCEEKDGKKIYSITEAGLTFLDENKSTVEEIFERVEETIDNLLSDPIPDVTRLVGRLVTQTYKAAWKLREDADKRGKVVDVLEKAMKELEELV